MMRVCGVPVLVFAVTVLGLASAHFPGSFHNIMMMVKKEDGSQTLSWKRPMKKARIELSPHRMWASIDPPGSLGKLNDESIHSNRIARSLKSIDETYENEIPSSPNQVVRSLSNRREARIEEDDEVTEAPEASAEVTEAPAVDPEATAEVIEPPSEVQVAPAEISEASEEVPVAPEDEVTEAPEDEVTEAPEEEEPTEPPVTEPPPVICGGDLSSIIDPHNPPKTDSEGRFLHANILSPGFEDGEYPSQDFECEWTLKVGKECQMGMLMFMINEGEIRETSRCNEDHLSVSYRGGQENKFCGILKEGQHQVTGSDIWTSQHDEIDMKLTFRATERPPSYIRNTGKPIGFNMTVSCFCWYWSPEFLALTTPSPPPTSSTTPIPTTPSTTTTEPPAEEPVTIVSEDGQGYEDEEVIDTEITVTAAPQEDGFEESGERFSDISNFLENNNGISDSPLVPELSSASSIGSLSNIAPLIPDISPEEGSNILDPETPNIDLMNTEALNPIVVEAGLLPLVSVQPDSPPKVSGELASTSQNDESNLNTNSEEESTTVSDISILENVDSKVSEPEEPLPVNTKPVPVDSNAQVTKPKPNNSGKNGSANKPNKPNKKPNKQNKPTKPPAFIPIVPL